MGYRSKQEGNQLQYLCYFGMFTCSKANTFSFSFIFGYFYEAFLTATNVRTMGCPCLFSILVCKFLSIMSITLPFIIPFHKVDNIPANTLHNYLLNFHKRNTRKLFDLCSKLTIKTPEPIYWRRFGVFFINFEHISLLFLMFLLLALSRQIFAVIKTLILKYCKEKQMNRMIFDICSTYIIRHHLKSKNTLIWERSVLSQVACNTSLLVSPIPALWPLGKSSRAFGSRTKYSKEH